MTTMSSIADGTMVAASMPHFEDGSINLQKLLRQPAESVVGEVMSGEATCCAPPQATAGMAAGSAS